MWQSFELAWFIAGAGMRRACKWSNVEAWCRGDNVERMNMVADQAWTGVGNLIAWRRETAGCRGDNATWKFSRDNMRNADTDLGGVVSLLAPPGVYPRFLLIALDLLNVKVRCLCYVVWWLLVIDFGAPRASLTEYLSKYSALLSFSGEFEEVQEWSSRCGAGFRVFGFL